MRQAIYPGSFDPPTLGHLDVIERASRIFDRLVVAVMVNSHKSYMFTDEERVQMVRECTGHLGNVEVIYSGSLLAGLAQEMGIDTLIKGIRNSADFESENQMYLINKKLNPALDTVFLPADERYLFVSSSAVKSVALSGGDIGGFVTQSVKERVLNRVENSER